MTAIEKALELAKQMGKARQREPTREYNQGSSD